MWDTAETGLRAALDATGRAYELKPGDGAFYGPKIDFDVLDSLGRAWQLGTIQLDYSNPERFDLTYTGEDNAAHRPVIIHRAVSGSFERFMAILIEHFAGAFPTWLAPEQVRVIPITDDQAPVAEAVTKRMRAAGIRAHADARSETLKYKIAEGVRMKVPYLAVIGKREAESDMVAVNVRGAGKEQKPAPVAVGKFVDRVLAEVKSRSLVLSAGTGNKE
jgi:threonyl-tRNA synthetase